MEVLRLVGYLLIVFAFIDFAGMLFDYDLTGVSWSPIVAIVVGGILTKTGEDES